MLDAQLSLEWTNLVRSQDSEWSLVLGREAVFLDKMMASEGCQNIQYQLYFDWRIHSIIIVALREAYNSTSKLWERIAILRNNNSNSQCPKQHRKNGGHQLPRNYQSSIRSRKRCKESRRYYRVLYIFLIDTRSRNARWVTHQVRWLLRSFGFICYGLQLSTKNV